MSKVRITLLALALTALTACSEVRLQAPKVSDDLLECDPSPPVPEAPVTDEKNAIYILELHEAGNDCRATLHDLADVVKRFRRR